MEVVCRVERGLGICCPSMAHEVLVVSCCALACSFGDGRGKRKCSGRLGGTLPFGGVGGSQSRDATSAVGCPSTAAETLLVQGQRMCSVCLGGTLPFGVSRRNLGNGMSFNISSDS